MKKVFSILTLAAILSLTGCVHHTPFEEEYFFQAMGKDGEIVITADTTKLKEKMPGVLATGNGVLDDIIARSERVSVAFYQDPPLGEEAYPADLASLDYYGGLEGDYGSFTINTALSWSSQFHGEKEEGIRYYTDDGNTIELAVPVSGLLLFASQDYVQAYLDTVSERFTLIGDDTAKLLADSLFGLYVRSPQTMIDLGLGLPYSVIAKMSDAIIYVNVTDEGGYVLNADITMQSEDLATTLLSLLRQNVVAELRRQGQRPDFAALSRQYYNEGRLVLIRDMSLTKEQVDQLAGSITDITGGVI